MLYYFNCEIILHQEVENSTYDYNLWLKAQFDDFPPLLFHLDEYFMS